MPTIFPNSPYFDDYDETKEFQQILFRPGRAVQARELTQLQTILQKQIQRIGDHFFKNGSQAGKQFKLTKSFDFNADYVKIRDKNINSIDVFVNAFTKGMTVTGLTSGLQAYLLLAEDGIETATNTKTLFVKYTTGSLTNPTVKAFLENEQLQITNEFGAIVNTVVAFSESATGKGSLFTLGESDDPDQEEGAVFYVDGSFLRFFKQTIVLDRYSGRPTCVVGITLQESIVNSDEDESLLDPAVGSTNFFAIGADRFKVKVVLTRRNLNDTDVANFYQLFTFSDGVLQEAFDEPLYNVIYDEIARRTFEESGDYTVTPFKLRVREHLKLASNGGLYNANAQTNTSFITGSADLVAVGIEPGIAYVKGRRVEVETTQYLPLAKGTATVSEDQQPVTFNYGNWIEINEVAGPWDIDNGVVISLRNANALSITNETYGATGAPGAEIGTARVKSLEYVSGNVGLSTARFKMYLYDLNLAGDNTFATVRSIYFNAPSGSDSIADLTLLNNTAILQQTNFNTGVFRFPQRAIKTLRDDNGSVDNSFEFKKSFDVTIAVDGTFTITSAIANEEFPFGLGALNNTQKRQNFALVLDQAAESANLSGNISFTSGSTLITGLDTIFLTQLRQGDRVETSSGNVHVILDVPTNTTLNVTTAVAYTEANVNYKKIFASGQYLDLTIPGTTGVNRTATVLTDTSVAVDVKENFTGPVPAKILCSLQKTNGPEIKKLLRRGRFVRINCNTAGTGGNYGLGFSDVFRVTAIYHGSTYSETNTNILNEFTVDTGQRDTIYDHGRIIKKSGGTTLTASSRLLVQLDYFAHDSTIGVGYLSFDSYPVDDTEALVNSIRTEQVPVFTSPTTGTKFDLRDSIDIRARISDTSIDTIVIGTSSENPASSTTLNIPLNGLRVPIPNENLLTDMVYYLSRRDRVYIDKDNKISILRGIPSLYPLIPEEPAVGMTIGIINMPPYPSLSSQLAKTSGRADYEITTKLLDNRRYTMKSIGAINQRINRLEYYSALNFLEKSANDLIIPSDVTGLNRFKNGFLVDNFVGHGVGNVTDPNYKVSVDPVKGELRPYFLIDNLELEFNEAESQNYLRAPKDAILTISNPTGTTFSIGQTITQGSITAVIRHVFGNKLYVEDVSGTFATTTFSGPGGSAAITNIQTFPEGDLVTLPYRHVLLARNRFATKPRNLVSEVLFTWVGSITLDPSFDNWTDTSDNPDVIVNFDNNLDNWNALVEPWGTQWNDWETEWSGVTDSQTNTVGGAISTRQDGETATFGQTFQDVTIDTITERERRSGTVLNVVPETLNYNLGNRIVNSSLATFIREQLITFNAIRLKPNTRVFPFFDGEPVSEFCRPIGGAYNAALVTDSSGRIDGEFRIPNNNSLRFRTGQRLFRLSDDSLDRTSFVTTAASQEFLASGIQQTQEQTILSTRTARLSSTQVTDTRERNRQEVSISNPTERDVGTINILERQEITNITNITQEITNITVVDPPAPPPPPPPADGGGDGDGAGGGGSDPLAQTFFVGQTSRGIFLTKLDVFFRTKHPTLGLTCQIREVLNGYPAEKVLPFGEIFLTSSEVNVSEDATSPTTFVFPSPVYLNNGGQYCFVLLPEADNPEYNIWVSVLGENQLNTSVRVSEQPYSGILFTSANDKTWTAHQSEDVKFNLYRAEFDNQVAGRVVFDNDDEDYVAVERLTGAAFDAGDTVRYAQNGATAIIEYIDRINNVLTLKKNTTSAVIRARINGTGNINTTSSSVFIAGNGTSFTTQAYANAVIYSANTNTRLGKVANVINDSNIQLDIAPPETLSANSYIIYDELTNVGSPAKAGVVETINNKAVNLFHTNISFLTFSGTSDVFSFRTRDTSTGLLSQFRLTQAGTNIELPDEVSIASNSNEITTFSGVKSFKLKNEFRTSFNTISPVFDLQRTGLIVVANRINNDATGEEGNLGNALARYISKRVILDDGQEAEDLKVYVTAYKPPGTDVKVYARIHNETDPIPFQDTDYIELQKVPGLVVFDSDTRDQLDYKEYEYVFPGSALTGPNGEVQYTSGSNTFTGFKFFAIKIVLLSSNTSVVPKVKDYRAIALQI